MYVLHNKMATAIKNSLKKYRIFLPTLWLNLLFVKNSSKEKNFAENLLLLPIDQRYNEEDMQRLAELVQNELRK